MTFLIRVKINIEDFIYRICEQIFLDEKTYIPVPINPNSLKTGGRKLTYHVSVVDRRTKDFPDRVLPIKEQITFRTLSPFQQTSDSPGKWVHTEVQSLRCRTV